MFMYPAVANHFPTRTFSSDVPLSLQNAVTSTIQSLNSKNFVATAVCARRSLEGLFKYLVADPQKRSQPLAKLIEQGTQDADLVRPLTTLSHAIRDGGNLGAHFDLEAEPTEEIARQMVKLLDYLISYLYELPKEIEALEQSLSRIKPNSRNTSEA
jgi:hypothetical protein